MFCVEPAIGLEPTCALRDTILRRNKKLPKWRVMFYMEPAIGLEPTTYALRMRRSTN